MTVDPDLLEVTFNPSCDLEDQAFYPQFRIIGDTGTSEWYTARYRVGSGLRIVGLTRDSGNIVANRYRSDENLDGVVDQPAAVHCTTPYPHRETLIVAPPGNYNAVGANMPAGMTLDEDTMEITYVPVCKESRFPAPACGGRRLRSTACHERTTPLVPLAALDSPNRGRRVACGSSDSGNTFYPEFKVSNGSEESEWIAIPFLLP